MFEKDPFGKKKKKKKKDGKKKWFIFYVSVFTSYLSSCFIKAIVWLDTIDLIFYFKIHTKYGFIIKLLFIKTSINSKNL